MFAEHIVAFLGESEKAHTGTRAKRPLYGKLRKLIVREKDRACHIGGQAYAEIVLYQRGMIAPGAHRPEEDVRV